MSSYLSRVPPSPTAVLHPREAFPPTLSRRTLLVNWWPSRPGGPVDLPAAFFFSSSNTDTVRQGDALKPSEPPGPPRLAQFSVCSAAVPFLAHRGEWAAQRIPGGVWDDLESDRNAGLPVLDGGQDSPLYVCYHGSSGASPEEGIAGGALEGFTEWSSLDGL